MSCLVCGCTELRGLFQATDRLYHTTSEKFLVARCQECGVCQLAPPPRPEELGRYYPSNYWFSPDESAAGRLEEAWRRLVLRDHVSFVEAAVGEGPVLDIGCGGGLFLGMLRKRGHRVIGLDISPQAASIAWKRQNVPAVAGLIPAVPLRAASFACVTMFHVLEHLHDPAAYLRAAWQLLRPGGRLIIQVPNAASWQFKLFGARWNGVDVPRHIINFRASDAARMMDRCGFEVTRRKYFSLRDNPAGFASSVAPDLDPMARRVRQIAESGGEKLFKDLVYLGILLAGLPFTVLEAACGAGSTVMLEGRKR